MTESTAVVNWADKLKEHAVAASALEQPSTLNISVRGGYMKLNGVDLPGSQLDCVIVAATFENQYYDPAFPFDPDNLRNPICFAMSLDGEDMKPDPKSTNIQNADCTTCQWMQWKSDPVRKKGKACKEKRKIALIPATMIKAGEIKKAEMAILALPPTSVGNWSNYVNLLSNEYQRPSFGMLSTVIARPHPRKQLEVTFEAKALVSDEFIGDILDLVEPAQKVMMTPYEGNPTDPTKAADPKKPKKY